MGSFLDKAKANDIEPKNKKILIVDDEKMFAFLLARLLRSRGYGAFFVYSAQKALDRINSEKYDLVITDIRMDGMSGFELIKTVSESQGANCPRFLVGTGTQFTLSDEQMKAFNVHKILEKPFPRPSRLFKEIEEAINSV
ncbi:MAG: response regulator [Candidatus Omnitrophica bacterium]|nr:response regulator [Candidatus Omnitrophota bacterium]